MFAWRSTRSESQRHYSGRRTVSSKRREPNGVGQGCELRGRRVQQERAARTTGEEGPVRVGQVIVRLGCGLWRGCALVYGCCKRDFECESSASEAYLTFGRAWERRETRRYLCTSTSTIESLDALPTRPRSRLTALRLARLHGHLTSRSRAVSRLSPQWTCHDMVLGSLFEALRSTCCVTLNNAACSKSRRFRTGLDRIHRTHSKQRTKILGKKSRLYTPLCASYLLSDKPPCLPHDQNQTD